MSEKRNTIVSPWRAGFHRHPTDPTKDIIYLSESFEYAEDGSNPRIFCMFDAKGKDSPTLALLDNIAEAHNLSITTGAGHAIWAVGKTPEDAIHGLFTERGIKMIDDLVVELKTENKFDWSARFTADGAWCKAAGVNVPGGVILTWWK